MVVTIYIYVGFCSSGKFTAKIVQQDNIKNYRRKSCSQSYKTFCRHFLIFAL